MTELSKIPTLSVIIPVYNEEKTIYKILNLVSEIDINYYKLIKIYLVENMSGYPNNYGNYPPNQGYNPQHRQHMQRDMMRECFPPKTGEEIIDPMIPEVGKLKK